MKINEIFEEIDYRIDETMSIADDVIAVSNDVAEKIKENIRAIGVVRKYGEGSIKSGEFIYNNFGLSFTIVWNRINFMAKSLNLDKLQTAGSVDIKENKLNFTVVTYSGGTDRKKYRDTIEDAVSGYYKLMLIGKPYASKRNYSHAKKILEKCNDAVDWAIASIICMGFEYEQCPYENGAYQYLMQSNDYGHNFRNVIKDTLLYKNLVYAIKAKNALLCSQAENGTDFVNQYLKKYRGLDFEKIISMTNRTEKGLQYSLGRAKTKALLDYKIQHNILENRIGMLEYKEKNIEEDLKNFLESN